MCRRWDSCNYCDTYSPCKPYIPCHRDQSQNTTPGASRIIAYCAAPTTGGTGYAARWARRVYASRTAACMRTIRIATTTCPHAGTCDGKSALQIGELCQRQTGCRRKYSLDGPCEELSAIHGPCD